MPRPNEKAVIYSITGRAVETPQTNADVVLSPLTVEVLRDIARNESCSKEWRKAAVKFLVQRKHDYQNYPEFKEFRDEIRVEAEAEDEVQSIVESAIEESL